MEPSVSFSSKSIPARSCYLSELSRSILPLHDRFLSHHSVTTPEKLYTHMDGLAVSGSHGGLRISLWITHSKKVSTGCHAGTRLYIKPTPSTPGSQPTRAKAGLEGRELCDHSLRSDASTRCSYSQNTGYYHSLLLSPGLQLSLSRCLQAPTVFLRGWILIIFTCLAVPSHPIPLQWFKGRSTHFS